MTAEELFARLAVHGIYPQHVLRVIACRDGVLVKTAKSKTRAHYFDFPETMDGKESAKAQTRCDLARALAG